MLISARPFFFLSSYPNYIIFDVPISPQGRYFWNIFFIFNVNVSPRDQSPRFPKSSALLIRFARTRANLLAFLLSLLIRILLIGVVAIFSQTCAIFAQNNANNALWKCKKCTPERLFFAVLCQVFQRSFPKDESFRKELSKRVFQRPKVSERLFSHKKTILNSFVFLIIPHISRK